MEFALRDVKEYAARSHDLNVDSLQLKLMHLEDLGRRTMHEDRELRVLITLPLDSLYGMTLESVRHFFKWSLGVCA